MMMMIFAECLTSLNIIKMQKLEAKVKAAGYIERGKEDVVKLWYIYNMYFFFLNIVNINL
jgi:hypothetical protein